MPASSNLQPERSNDGGDDEGDYGLNSATELDEGEWQQKEQGTKIWITHPGADFLNSLCPFGGDTFPDFEWLAQEERAPLREALNYGFNAVRERFEAEYMRKVLCFGATTDAEKIVLHIIKRKTLLFRKIAEAMTYSTFVHGARTKDGRLLTEARYGLCVADYSYLTPQNVSRAIKGLMAKGLIDRVESTWSRPGRESFVYTPMRIEHAIWTILPYARHMLSEARKVRGPEIIDCLEHEIEEHQGYRALSESAEAAREAASEGYKIAEEKRKERKRTKAEAS